MRKLHIRDGLLWNCEDGRLLRVRESDRIAQANGLDYAERFVNKYDGTTVLLDENNKVVEVKR